MKISSTKFKDLKVIKSFVNKDKRGVFREIYKKINFKKNVFPFICTSTSKKNVLRGLHLQTKYPQGKYITVLKGEIYDVALDLRIKSKTFCKYFSINLSDKNGLSIYIPPGFAHGFSVLEDTVFQYKCSNLYHKPSEMGIHPLDPQLGILWGTHSPVVSAKDLELPAFLNFNSPF
jgi:dTDP-4-dehydrorhamnose 3,5-epimerase